MNPRPSPEDVYREALVQIATLDLDYPEACCEGEQARDAIIEAWTIARRAIRVVAGD